jgi:hypothetical protein
MNLDEFISKVVAKYPRSRIEPLSQTALLRITADHPGLPTEYLELLTTFGHGTIGRDRFMLYSGPVSSEEIFGDGPDLRGLLLIGDDLAGYHVALRQHERGWQVVEFDHSDLETLHENRSLYECLTCILSLPDRMP